MTNGNSFEIQFKSSVIVCTCQCRHLHCHVWILVANFQGAIDNVLTKWLSWKFRRNGNYVEINSFSLPNDIVFMWDVHMMCHIGRNDEQVLPTEMLLLNLEFPNLYGETMYS